MTRDKDPELARTALEILADLRSPNFKSELYANSFDAKECVIEVKRLSYTRTVVDDYGLKSLKPAPPRTFVSLGFKRNTEELPIVSLLVEPQNIIMDSHMLITTMVGMAMLYDKAVNSADDYTRKVQLQQELLKLTQRLPYSPEYLGRITEIVAELKTLED